jgi:D-amino-acid oxidase
LSTALLAQQQGFDVTIYSASPPNQTTSAKAGASFKPHLVEMSGLPPQTLQRSWDHFVAIEQSFQGASGVRRHLHWEAGSLPLKDEPYLKVVEDVTYAEAPTVPGGYAYGRSFTTFLIDTPVYISWLVDRFLSLGGELQIVPPMDLAQVSELEQPLVANCTGLGGRTIFGDTAVEPARGQVVLVEPLPDMSWSISADGFYVYPRRDSTVIGGTVEMGVDDESTDSAVVDLLLRAAQRVLPHVRELKVLETYAGLRPYRQTSVRVATEDTLGKRLVHNYGHGGAGVTLSWGTAELAVRLLLTS